MSYLGGQIPNLNPESIFVLCVLPHSLTVILYNILNNFIHETKFVHIESSYSWCLVNIPKQSDFGAFWISVFWTEQLSPSERPS